MYYDVKKTGQRIEELRKAREITVNEFCEKLNITDRHYRRLKQGENAFSVDLLVEISFFFHVSLDYLILGERYRDEKNSLEFAIQILESAKSTF